MIEKLNIKLKCNREKLEKFILAQNLHFDADIDLCLVVFDEDKIVASASKKRDVFKMIAVDPNYQSMNYVNKLISELISYSYEEGIFHYFIFTKTKYEKQFASLGFNLLVSYEDIGLFEKGQPSFEQYYDNIKLDASLKTGAIVMNNNPFTLGHLYLVEQALKQVEQLIIFVVEEDKSYFKFKDRFELVRQGVAHLENVIVVPSGPYIISQATFPTYFLKELNDATLYYTNIDIRLFMKIMDKLNISLRFVGEEPLDELTNFYNQQLKNNLGDRLVIIPRKEEGSEVISASRVRKYLEKQDFDSIKPLVPEHVYQFLLDNYQNVDFSEV